MKYYYIYHIPGVKIGCTDRLEDRLNEQGYSISDCEILETHTDIYVASNREKELQKQYGYKVDIAYYYTSKKNALKAGQIAGKLPRTDKQYNAMAKAREIGKNLGAATRKEQTRIPISAYRKSTNEYVGTYESMMECARQLNLKIGDIWQCLNPNRSQISTKGYTFKKEPK